MVKHIRKTLHYLFHKFDHSHSVLGGITVPLYFIPYTHGMIGLSSLIGFCLYEMHQSNVKGDDGWPEIKGFLFGHYSVAILTGITLGILKLCYVI